MALLRRGTAGVSGFVERRRIASGAWRELFPGIVWEAAGASEPTAEEWTEAALLWAGPDAILGTSTAARLHKLDGEWPPATVHLIVPRRQALSAANAVISRVDLEPVDVCEVEGQRCTTISRTVVDLAAALDPTAFAVAFESAWRLFPFVRAELDAHLKEAPKRRGARRLREALADSRTRRRALLSALEVRMWRFFPAHRLPIPVPDHRVADAEGEMFIDFAYPDRKVAIETDGRAFHGDKTFSRDRRRWQRLQALGWTVIKVTWDDVTREPEKLAERLRLILKQHPQPRRPKKRPAAAEAPTGLPSTGG